MLCKTGMRNSCIKRTEKNQLVWNHWHLIIIASHYQKTRMKPNKKAVICSPAWCLHYHCALIWLLKNSSFVCTFLSYCVLYWTLASCSCLVWDQELSYIYKSSRIQEISLWKISQVLMRDRATNDNIH